MLLQGIYCFSLLSWLLGFYPFYQYCYCQYWKCTSIAAQIIPLPNSGLTCSLICSWDFLLKPSGLQNHFGSSCLVHYIVVVTFFGATAQNRKIVYNICTGSPAFSVYIRMTVFKHIKTHTFLETCLPDKSNCHCICCFPPFLHFSPWVICTLY